MKSILLTCLLFLNFPVYAVVHLLDHEGWKVDMAGDLELDAIYDTKRSLLETMGNQAIDRPNGEKGRTQFSIRNTRLSFNVMAPAIDELKSRAFFEFDLQGYDPAPGSQTQSEASFFNNAGLRVRHAFLQADDGDWSYLAGQTWHLMGWQPIYFIPTTEISPFPAMLYNRTTQFRAVKTIRAINTYQFSLGVLRPPQRDGNYPSVEAGARIAFDSIQAAYTGGGQNGHRLQPLSLALSGTVRHFEIPRDAVNSRGNPSGQTGAALAVDALVPVVGSKTSTDVSNNLIFGGEYTIGCGFGDEFINWTGNQNQPLNAGSVTPDKNVDLDAGIGGFDANNRFALIRLQTANVYFQYHLPAGTRAYVSGGFSRLFSPNMNAIVTRNGTAAPWKVAQSTEEAYFLNIARDLTDQIRMAFEYAHVRSGYVDGVDGEDNRFQLTTYFIL